MAKRTSKEELSLVLRARYPLVCIATPEEGRVESFIRSFGPAKIWSITKGFILANAPQGWSQAPGDKITDPLKALDTIMIQEAKMSFILKDFHRFWEKDITVIRKVRDLGERMKQKGQTCCFVVPTPQIPLDLEKEIYLIDWDLPTKQEIQDLLHEVTRKVPSLWDMPGDQKDSIAQAATGLTLGEAENAFARSLADLKTIDPRVVSEEKKQIVKASGILEYFDSTAQMEDVGGHGILKDWVRKRGKAFSQNARAFGLPPPRGLLAVGVAGTGKSLISKVVGNIWEHPTLRLDLGKVFGGLVGSSEANIRKVIKTAEAVAPCLVFIDEIDKALTGTSGGGDSGTSARVFGTFLSWMNDHDSSVFVIATANNISGLPPELLRRGRFDEIFFCDLPTLEERREIFGIHLKKRGRNPGTFSVEELAGMTQGFTGAEIEQVIISALYDAFDEGRELATGHLLQAARETIPLSVTMEEKIAEMREWAKTRARPTTQARSVEQTGRFFSNEPTN